MSAQLIDGRALAETIREDIKNQVTQRVQQKKSVPGLAVVLVGNDPASASYVKHKQQACENVGIYSKLYHLKADISKTDLLQTLADIDANPKIHGILVQLPLPEQIKADEIVEYINPRKDVDGFHPYNLGRLTGRRPLLRPCTPYGVIQLLKTTKIDLTGKHAVVVSASNIVGRPMALELLLQKCTVTVCHRFTKNLAEHVKVADILISAIGKPGIVKSEWIKSDAIVIDVAFLRQADGNVCGDIDFKSARERASWITPVPGGVGPMTVTMLLQNTLLCAELCDI